MTPEHSRLFTLAEKEVEICLGSLSPRLNEALASLAVHLVWEADHDLLEDGIENDLLGLFTGATWQDVQSHDVELPPQILLFLGNIWEESGHDKDIFCEEVRTTFYHELGHYLGWDEDEVAQRGLE